jgi:hypothetical protein
VDFAGILRDCIQVDPTKRPTAAEIAERAKQLRGDVTTIALPKPAPSPAPEPPQPAGRPKAKAESGGGGAGGWFSSALKYVQEQGRSLVSSGATQWAIKATFASSDPPAPKYVRRVILASIRRTELSPIAITEFLLNERPWQADANVAAKCLYLILLVIQYENTLDEFIPITVKTDQMIATFADVQHPSSRFVVAAINALANIVRAKVMLHATHKELLGNLALGNKKPSDSLAGDLARYLASITPPAQAIAEAAAHGDTFALLVLCQPAIDEVANAVKLAAFLNAGDATASAIAGAEKVLDVAKRMPYLQTAVAFPDGSGQPPFPRFVVSQKA